MTVTQENRERYRAKVLSREYKWLFMALPAALPPSCLSALPDRWKNRLTGWLWRQLFLAADGRPHVAGEHVLADLREFAAPPGGPLFSTDALVMARRVGRREVFERIVMFLNLDEKTVQYLMEIDDGLE